jgi:amidase
VYGHKPSYGVIPIRGHIAPLPGQLLQFEMGVLGPLAQSAHDIELAMDVLAAPAILGPAAWRVAIPPSRHERLEDFRVAVWVDDTYAVDADYRKNIEAYLGDLRALGVQLDTVARPQFDPAASYQTYLTGVLSIASAGLPEPVIQAVLDNAATLPPGSDDSTDPVSVGQARSHTVNGKQIPISTACSGRRWQWSPISRPRRSRPVTSSMVCRWAFN